MYFKILSVNQLDDSIVTTVQTELNSSIVTLDVNHFQPKDEFEIYTNIQNRILSEQNKIDSIKTCSDILNIIKIEETITF